MAQKSISLMPARDALACFVFSARAPHGTENSSLAVY